MSEHQQLPTALYRAEQVRELDRCAIQDHGIPGINLMRRAGEAAFECLRQRYPEVRSLSIWCGSGNNGGDGYIIAGLARRRGFTVQLVQVGAGGKAGGDAGLALDWAREQGVEITEFNEAVRPEGQLIVDALLGTGLAGEVRGDFKLAIESLNGGSLPIFAIDIASGLCGDSGVRLGVTINADATITFIGVKQGLLTAQGPACSGSLYFDNLAVPETVYESVMAAVQRVDVQQLAAHLAPRSRDAHKGDFGHVLIVGGNSGMGGATLMAAQAAGRAGAGLVSLATRPEHVPAVLARCPEVMARGVGSGQDLEPLLDRADVIVIGPGLGQAAWSEQVLRAVLATDKPLIVDADALNLIAAGSANHCHRDNWIITPHPGEASRLLGQATTAIQADRFAAVRALQEKFGGVAVLKGAGSLVCGDQSLQLCSDGNPGMASGGMGDVLSGILGGLLAQGHDLTVAAALGVCVHAAAADRAAQAGERGMMATDLLAHIRSLVNPAA